VYGAFDTAFAKLLCVIPPPACIGKGGSMQSDGSVCDSVGDLVSDNPRSSGMAEASYFILCLHIGS